MNRNLLVAVLVLGAFSSGAVVASLILTTSIESTVNLQTTYVDVLGENGVTKITTLDFGTLYPNQENYKTIFIKNLTEEQIKVSWNATGIPSGVTLKVMKYQNNVWSEVLQNTDLVNLPASSMVKMTVNTKFGSGTGGVKNFKININSFIG